VRNDKVLHRFKEVRYILQIIKRRKVTQSVIPCLETVFKNTLPNKRQN